LIFERGKREQSYETGIVTLYLTLGSAQRACRTPAAHDQKERGGELRRSYAAAREAMAQAVTPKDVAASRAALSAHQTRVMDAAYANRTKVRHRTSMLVLWHTDVEKADGFATFFAPRAAPHLRERSGGCPSMRLPW
jgi:hypothetical protein